MMWVQISRRWEEVETLIPCCLALSFPNSNFQDLLENLKGSVQVQTTALFSVRLIRLGNMGSVSQLLLMAEIFGLTSFLNFFPEIAYLVSLSFVTKYFAKIQFSPALDLWIPWCSQMLLMQNLPRDASWHSIKRQLFLE